MVRKEGYPRVARTLRYRATLAAKRFDIWGHAGVV